MRRCRAACATAIFAANDFCKLLEAQLATPNVQQRPDDGAYHVAQKAVGGNGENEGVVFFIFGPARFV